MVILTMGDYKMHEIIFGVMDEDNGNALENELEIRVAFFDLLLDNGNEVVDLFVEFRLSLTEGCKTADLYEP